ncbi:MAG: OmpH family outer membrane protein [Pontibacterium sp.]
MKLFKLLVLSVLLTVSHQAMAEKMAVLGIQQALLASDAAAEFRAQLKGEFSAEQTQLLDLEKQAKAAQSKLQTNQNLASKEQLQQMQVQFQKVFTEYQRLGKSLQQKRLKREQAFVKAMKPKLDKVVQQLIDDKGYDVIIAKDATFYATKELDITAAVVELLNKQ